MLIGYARVSTIDQNPALQLDALTAAGAERIFQEKVSSSKERPELQAALNFMRAGDVLLIWKLDRMARSTKELIETAEELARRGIEMRCLAQPIDTTNAAGRLFYTMIAAFAEFEREIIRERTKAGLRAAVAAGRKGGRPPALDKKQLAAARAMMRDPALTIAEIATQLGVSKSALYRYFPGGKFALIHPAQNIGPDLSPNLGLRADKAEPV